MSLSSGFFAILAVVLVFGLITAMTPLIIVPAAIIFLGIVFVGGINTTTARRTRRADSDHGTLEPTYKP